MKSIRHIAQQYGGEVTIRTEDHWFVLTVLIPRRTGLMAMLHHEHPESRYGTSGVDAPTSAPPATKERRKTS